MTSFYPRLLVFGLRPNGEDVPLEGELQKCFARSLPFFHELVEFQSELRGVIVNLVQQLEAIYTIDAAHVYSSFFACHLRSVFSSLVSGFAVLVTLDEIIAQNLSIGHSMSLFTRFVPLDHCLIVPGLGFGLICSIIPYSVNPILLLRFRFLAFTVDCQRDLFRAVEAFFLCTVLSFPQILAWQDAAFSKK